MELALWTYEGPPHIGAMRIVDAMRGLHYVLHAPQGDTYADLLFTMIQRNGHRPPVTYTTFQARDLGGDTAGLFKRAVLDSYERFKPEAILVGASCTAELIQDDPGGLAATLGLPIPVVAVELPAYQKKENWGAAETLYQIIRSFADRSITRRQSSAPLCNILGPCSLGFRHRDDIQEVKKILQNLGVDINLIVPLGSSPTDLAKIGAADFNVVLYPEIAGVAAAWLNRNFGQPATKTIPIGVGATKEFCDEIARLVNASIDCKSGSRLPWYSRSVDSTYLTGKRVFIFGDATHAIAAARIASEEFGFSVVGLGTYSREFARDVRIVADKYKIEALISDDYLAVEAAISACQPDLVLGTQMERHVAKRLGIACSVISAPVHVQDFPARYAPQMGDEGANVIFDTWVHPLMMGLEEHLIKMFKDDFEFHPTAAPSHLGGAAQAMRSAQLDAPEINERSVLGLASSAHSSTVTWTLEAEKELKKIPFFVRGKARRNTESFAKEKGVFSIGIEVLYDAKSYFGR